MTPEMLIVLGILAAAIVLFASGRVRVDYVALLIPLALLLAGILPAPQALAGFSDPAVLMIAGLFVVGESLVATGIAHSIGGWLTRAGGGSESRLLILLMTTAAAIGAFMSSTGVVAIFIPIVLGICARTGMSRRRLLMPLAFAALISGMLSLIATAPNLVINAELLAHGLRPFGFFEITPFGLVVLVIGIVYMLVTSRFLSRSENRDDARRHGLTIRNMVEAYAVAGELRRCRVLAASSLAGTSVAGARIRTRFGVTLLGIEREERFARSLMPALADSQLHAGDILYLLGLEEPIRHAEDVLCLTTLPLSERHLEEARQELGVAEVMLAPESPLLGTTLRQAQFRSRYGLTVLGLKRKGRPVASGMIDQPLSVGDTLLVVGSWVLISRLQQDHGDFIVLTVPVEMADVAPARRRAPAAAAILVLMTLAMTFSVVPNVAAVLLAALALVALGCIGMERAYEAVNWQTVVLVAGMLPLATALQSTGATTMIVDHTAQALGEAGPLAMLAVVFLITSAVGLFVSNTATAVLMAPVAIGVAKSLGLSPHAFGLIVALASSSAFVTPISSPVNTLVLGPGGYRFIDFVILGGPLLLLSMVVSVLLVAQLYPL